MDTTMLITVVLLLLVILATGHRTTEQPTVITVSPAQPTAQGAGCAETLLVGLLVLILLLMMAGLTK